MRNSLRALVLLLPLLATAQQGGPFRLVALHVSGSQRFSDADVLAATGLKIGGMVQTSALRGIADALSESGAFDEVSYKYGPAGAGIAVDFKVSDALDFLPVTFDNFVWWNDEQLMEALRARVPLFHGEVPADGRMAANVVDALDSLLETRGIHGKAQFQLQEQHLGSRISGGVFSVEGVDVGIRAVSFPGAAAEDVPGLQQASTGLLTVPYRRSTAEAYAGLNFLPVYLRRGFLKASFSPPRTTPVDGNAQAPKVDIAFPVAPGRQYRLAAVRWAGNRALQAFDLDQLITVKDGEPANALALQSSLESIHHLYLTRGYLRQIAHELPTFDDAQQVVSYEMRIEEGDCYKFASLQIEGLESAMRDRLRDSWHIREGEAFNPDYIRTFLREAEPTLGPGMVTHVEQEVDDQNKTVTLTLRFSRQRRVQ